MKFINKKIIQKSIFLLYYIILLIVIFIITNQLFPKIVKNNENIIKIAEDFEIFF